MRWLNRIRWALKAASAYDILRELGARYRSKSGKAVNRDTALEVSMVVGCLRVIGNGMSQVPLKLMRESPDGKTRLPAKEHPLYDVLGRRPNPWQTSVEYRETLSWHTELCGNAYSFINRGVRGNILELIPFEPGAVTVKRAADRTLTYTVRGEDGQTKDFPEEAIWHYRGPGWNGYQGMEIVRLAREAIGLSIAIDESQAAMYGRGVRAAGVWSVGGKLNPQQYADLRAWIDQEYGGPDKTARPFIMDREAKWVPTQMTGLDAQTRETRRDQVEEICRFFGVLPIMVGFADKTATYASAEQMFLAHVVHCLSPRWTRFEQSADTYLLTDEERASGLYFDHVEEGMIRGAVKDTKDAIIGYVNGGVMTPNEGRAKLDLNPDTDPASDRLRIPVNTAQAPEADPDDDTDKPPKNRDEPPA